MKRGLVIGGGGRNGAFAAGAIYRMVSEYGWNFDAISGTSTGAIISSFVLTDEIEILNDLYRGGISNKNIMISRNPISSWISGSLYDNTPLKTLLKKYINIDKLRKKWDEGKYAAVTMVNYKSGKAETKISSPDNMALWHDYVLASASVPLLMDPVNINGDDYVDGGIRENVPIRALFEDKSITSIVVVVNSPFTIDPISENPSGFNDRLLRMIYIMSDEISNNDIMIRRNCRIRGKELILIYPNESLGDAFDFDPAKMEEIWLKGFDRVTDAIIEPIRDLGPKRQATPTT